MPGDFFFLNYGVQDGNVMQGLFRVNKTTYQLEVYNGSQWVVVNVEGDATATPLTTAQRMAYAPASGALIWDVDEELLYVGDGLTTGGVPLGSAAVSMTSAQRTAITPRAGMLIWDTTIGALFIGDGDTPGGINTSTNLVRGATNGIVIEDGIAKADTATVEEVLTGSTGFVNVDADNLRGALSVGQAVDVSCNPIPPTSQTNFATSVSIDDGTTWISTTSDSYKAMGLIEGEFVVERASAAANTNYIFGWQLANFPKYASGLKYLLLCDAKVITGTMVIMHAPSTGTAPVSGVPYTTGYITSDAGYIRIAIIASTAHPYLMFAGRSAGNIRAYIKNWRQYEVTALTDEAIAYIAQLPDPDAFFRSTSVYSIRNKYLIKQDMVCPFIPTINMPDNSDLTVAAGLSYKIKYTNDNIHTITADTIPTDAYGWDTHIQMFIKGTSAINFQAPLVLMDALTPNAGHNMVVKWRNGDALVYVDDTNAGYIVVKASGTGTGTLNDAISNDYTDYVIFSGDLAGTVIDAGDATFAGGTGFTAVNILGNGTEDTVITGNISATSGKTINFQNLTIDGGTFGGKGKTGRINLSDVIIAGDIEGVEGPIELGDVDINATIFSTGRILFGTNVTIKSTSKTGVIDVSGNTANIGTNSVTLNGITIRNRPTGTDAIISLTGTDTTTRIIDCVITGNTSTRFGGGLSTVDATICYINGSTFSNNRANQGGAIRYGGRYLELNDCLITGNTSVYGGALRLLSAKALFKNCTIIGNTATALNNFGGSLLSAYSNCDITFENCTTDGNVVTTNCSNSIITLIGNNTFESMSDLSYADNDFTSVHFVNGSTTTFNGDVGKHYTSNSLVSLSIGSYTNPEDKTTWIIGGEATIIRNEKTITISGCEFQRIVSDKFYYVTVGSMDVWSSTNATFYGDMDARNADTIKISDCTFIYKVNYANRIQLPSGSTNSFFNNAWTANTKIFDAGLIVVGDDPSSPSGTATIVNAAGSSITVSGIGTYIDKEGDNDFVANNATNVVPVDASTTGAKYLGTVLSATTGETGANRFAKIDSGAVAVVNEATNAVNKQIITHDYEPILGGTFSLTSATVNEATKTVAIQSGGTMSIVNIRGGKDSVIDLGGTNAFIQTGSALFENCTLTNGYPVSPLIQGGAFYNLAETTINNVTVSGNSSPNMGGGIMNGHGTVNVISSIVVGNSSLYVPTANDIGLTNGKCVIEGSTVGYIGFGSSSAIVELKGVNVIEKISPISSDAIGTVTISSGAILDLTGNTNTTPIAPGGGIVFKTGGATVLYGSGAVSGSYMMDNVTLPAGAKLTNTAVVDLGGQTVTIASNASISGAELSNGRANLQNGGVVDDITLKGINLYTYNGGVANGVTVESGGFLIVSSGATANNADVQSAAKINNYGVLNEPVISSGGTLNVFSGGTALLVTSNTGAIVTVADGGYITYK